MKTKYIWTVALSMIILILSLPIIFAEELSRTYDANGNLISDGKYFREYDGLNQLFRVRLGNTSNSPILEEYKWHPVEERIIHKKIYYNGVFNYSVYYLNENIVAIVNSSGTFYEKYVYQDGILVALVNSDGQKQAIHNDHKGTNTLITDSTSAVVENTFYSPYGEIISGGKNSRYGYEGKEYDSLTDDIDFKFRKYEADIIIYDKADTVIKNPYDAQSLNHYMFERANPYGNTDPDGHIAWAVAVEAVDYYDLYTAWERYQQNPSKQNKRTLLLAASGLIPGIPNIKRIHQLFEKGKDLKGIGKLLKKAEDWFKANKEFFEKASKKTDDVTEKSKFSDGIKKSDNSFNILHPNKNDELTKTVHHPNIDSKKDYTMDIYNKGEVTVHRYGVE